MDNEDWISELARPDATAAEEPTLTALRRAARELEQYPVDELAFQRLLRRVHTELDAEPSRNLAKPAWWSSSVATAAVVVLALAIQLQAPEPQPEAMAPLPVLADVAVAEEKMASADRERRQVAAAPQLEAAPSASGRAQLAQSQPEALAKRASPVLPALSLVVADHQRTFTELEELVAATPGLGLEQTQMRNEHVVVTITCATGAACAARSRWLRPLIAGGEVPVDTPVRVRLTTVDSHD